MKVEIDPGLLKEIRKLDRSLKERFYNAVERLARNPEVGKPLQYDYKGCRRMRIDPFRIVYKVKEDTVFIVAFDHRGVIYK